MTTSASANPSDSPPGSAAASTATAAPSELEKLTGDYDEAIVPQNKRRTKTAMFLIWATLQASVSIVYTGFLARSEGLRLGQLLIACVIGTLAILAYGLGAANAGAATGQGVALLARSIFGRIGTGVVSILLIVMGIGWYGFQARFLAQLFGGLFTVTHIAIWAAVIAILMTANNIFGFRGVATYARFIAAPLLLLWGAYALIKSLATTSVSGAFAAAPHVAAPTTIMVIVALLVGSAAWGNEPDIFRYSQGRPWWNLPALVCGYTIGIFLFPIVGYLMAEQASASDLNTFVRYIVSFSLFGVAALAFILFAVNQFALNDGNLYEAVNALQNLIDRVPSWRRVYSVLVLGVIGAILAVIMGSLQTDFFIVAGISAIFVPSATTIIAVDIFVMPRLTGLRRPVHRITSWSKAATCNWLGLIALVVGAGVGAVTGGLIPGLSGFGTTNIGFPALQAWVISGGLYVLLALAVPRERRAALLGFPHTADTAEEAMHEEMTASEIPS